ncbi:alpha/beta hydrolase [Burkholderia sp. S171]|uniref:alpha/beta hydrolase n=1 Tax=Burkholderia sp. S171 TaxID=1641860 RepID=UPI00131BAAB5|nr:alpha/beta hydrolase [Burkholderia sp. S171]
MLETEMTDFVRRTYAMYPPDTATMTIAEQRTLYDNYAKVFTPPLPDGLTIETATLDSVAGHRIPLRLYRKTNGAGQAGTVLYFHGGGYVLGSLDSHEAITARLAADTGMHVVAVDYRLAPERPAPAAHEDCIEVTLAAINGRLPFAALPAKLQLIGDSAGGNLAASVATVLRDRDVAGVAGVVAIYPALGREPALPARDTEAHAPMLTLADVHAYRELYWQDREPYPQMTPLDASHFGGLPPTLAIGVEHDPLRDDACLYIERIRAAGGDGTLWIGEGLVHGCLRALDTSPGVKLLYRKVCEFLTRPQD